MLGRQWRKGRPVADIKAEISNAIRWMVWTSIEPQCVKSLAGLDRMLVAIVLKILRQLHIGMPRGNQLHEQANRR